jgi:hypothetical protein
MQSGYKKAGVITSQEARNAWKLAGDHGDKCQVCHVPHHRSGWLGMAVHHIAHGSNGRSDEPCNMLLVCSRCHAMIHDGQHRDDKTNELLPPITLGNVLWVKSHTDDWDEDRLTELYHRDLPAWDILPAYYMAERIKWRGMR